MRLKSAERDDTDLITGYLLDGGPDVVVGSGSEVFTNRSYSLSLRDFEEAFNYICNVGVFAYGPGSHHFNGFYPNYEIANKIINLLQLR